MIVMSKALGDLAGLATMVAKYKAHNDEIAAKHGLLPPPVSPACAAVRDAHDHLARSRRTPTSVHKLLALQQAVESLASAVERTVTP